MPQVGGLSGACAPLVAQEARSGGGRGSKHHRCRWHPPHSAQRGTPGGLEWMAWAQLARRAGQVKPEQRPQGVLVSRKDPEGGAGGQQPKVRWFIEGLVQTLIKIQTGMIFNLTASPSSQKTNE